MFNLGRMMRRARSDNQINDYVRAEYKNEIRSLTQNGFTQSAAINGVRNRLGL